MGTEGVIKICMVLQRILVGNWWVVMGYEGHADFYQSLPIQTKSEKRYFFDFDFKDQ